MNLLKNSITMRGDCLYCPLSLSLDSYGNCLTDCHHCYLRNLNHVWGTDLKPADLELLDKRLETAPRIKEAKTPLSAALKAKKTIRWGNKTDPFQECEKEHKISKQIFSLLVKHDWSFVIQTRFTGIMMEYHRHILRANERKLITIMPVISPGMEKDWEIFERGRTTPPQERMKHCFELMQSGVPVGVNGEPFIPGFHTEKDFEDALKRMKSFGIRSYNTYSFHFNAYVAKRLHAIGIDIEKIWFYNQDTEWRKILANLLDISKRHNITLGCPDFVNTGANWVEKANTCCGVNVPNPCTFNSHYFKMYKQQGLTDEQIVDKTWDGTGDYNDGVDLIKGSNKKMYNLKDAGL